MDFPGYLEKKRGLVNQWLASFIEERLHNGRRLCRAMTYSLMADGKRLRPVLCMAAAEAVGAPEDDHVTSCGGALEMIHTYSLIHDDLPAMDDDALRRGKATCHVHFDEATAILAGDALLSLAFQVLTEISLEKPAGISAMHRIAKACGYDGMIEGQMRDMEAEGAPGEVASLRDMHQFKTGALIGAAAVSGAILGGGSDAQIRALSEYAGHIGLAFQVADDILNVEGDPETMGKAAGTDKDRDKATYPGLMGIAASRQYSRELANNALQALSVFDSKAEPLRALADYVIERRR
ncbi:MAG: polyprenyl synthetase family protein [Desulfosalsimonadaceae bacterium]